MPVRVCAVDLTSVDAVIADVLVGAHSFVEGGEVYEGLEDGAYLSLGVGGAVVF